MSDYPIKRALISVSDKTGLVPFASALVKMGVELLSTGGTYKMLSDAGLPVIPVDEVTHFPEMMGGRLKTLHPMVHGGILGRRDQDTAIMAEHHIPEIDLVVVNLYPFSETVAKPDCTNAQAIEQIDIGGPTMIRSAAKNHAWVSVVVDAADYAEVLSALQTNKGASSQALRSSLALKAFAHTAAYDASITRYLSGIYGEPDALPTFLPLSFTKVQSLRYGENPHQQAAFYAEDGATSGWPTHQLMQGKPLSFNNIADANAAWQCLLSLPKGLSACVIVKHANPSGVAIADTLVGAYDKAYKADSVSAFGGIIAFNQAVDASVIDTILSRQFVEVIIAPAYTPDALTRAAVKPNVRLVVMDCLQDHKAYDLKRVDGGLLVQSQDLMPWDALTLTTPTKAQPSAEDLEDAQFAWAVCQHVKSNAIVYAKGHQTLGIGAGQMSRIFSAEIAARKAADAELVLDDAVMASDAFFPFADSVEVAARLGIRVIVQPGGSMRDAEVIAAADAHGICMILTGVRHFKH